MVAARGERERLTADLVTGRVLEWKGNYGWIEPLLVLEHPGMSRHEGHIFVHSEDLVPPWGSLAVGTLVEFHVYHDGEGLGAEECFARKVLRLTLPRRTAYECFGASGERLAEFERTWGVAVRAYEWCLPDGSQSDLGFLLFEVWGRPEVLVSAALELSTREDRKCRPRVLVPETRLFKVNLMRLRRCCRKVELSEEIAISVPMPCRTLSLKGTRDDCSEALWALIEQVCD
eukprot:TRINITY_DN16719_c0_g3_i1.p1 TRINITY_DN16719_c0_g3~~TRINITY_DN16719_c0_g3_i1.p1  ORF type:complete len:250 (-),score=31.47 TRINITY_DN16719_c0_g3_i1:123-815(-)